MFLQFNVKDLPVQPTLPICTTRIHISAYNCNPRHIFSYAGEAYRKYHTPVTEQVATPKPECFDRQGFLISASLLIGIPAYTVQPFIIRPNRIHQFVF